MIFPEKLQRLLPETMTGTGALRMPTEANVFG